MGRVLPLHHDAAVPVVEGGDEPEQVQILAHELTYPDRTISLKNVLTDPTMEDINLYLLWDEHNRLVEPVALKAYRTLNTVITDLYPAEP